WGGGKEAWTVGWRWTVGWGWCGGRGGCGGRWGGRGGRGRRGGRGLGGRAGPRGPEVRGGGGVGVARRARRPGRARAEAGRRAVSAGGFRAVPGGAGEGGCCLRVVGVLAQFPAPLVGAPASSGHVRVRRGDLRSSPRP